MTELARAGAALPLLNSVRLGTTLAGRRVEFVDWGFYPPEPWRNYWHSHSYFEFCYAYAGRGTFRLGALEHPVGAGELFLARPGEVHEITTDARDPLGIVFWSWTMVPERGPRGAARPGSPETAALLDAVAAGPRQVVPAAGTPLPRLLATLAEEAALRGRPAPTCWPPSAPHWSSPAPASSPACPTPRARRPCRVGARRRSPRG